MIVKEIKAKTCMTKSKLTDYVINPYTGCEHACRYCYADFIRRFQNIKEKWGEFVYAKTNCPELLKKELEKNKPGCIFMSSVCDCYMPIEGKFKLTRKILETIVNSKYKDKFNIEILTKSALVKRDFDLLKKLDVELGMSINSLNEEFSRIVEPLASPPKLRIETLKEAKKQGIKVFGFISPVTPFTNLERLFKELKFCDYVWVEILNIRKSTIDRLFPLIKKEFPDKYPEFENMLENYDNFCINIEKEARRLERVYGLKIQEVVRHDKTK